MTIDEAIKHAIMTIDESIEKLKRLEIKQFAKLVKDRAVDWSFDLDTITGYVKFTNEIDEIVDELINRLREQKMSEEKIEKTCENCRYEYEDMEGIHCRHCIHNAEEKFEPKDDNLIFRDGLEQGYDNAIDVFKNTLIPRLTDAIYQKDVASMTNLINDVARELKAGGKNE